MGLRLLAYWNCGFESRLGHGCLSVVSIMCCQVDVCATGWSLVQRSPTECGVSKSVMVKPRQMRWPRPPRGCRAMGGGGKFRYAHFHADILKYKAFLSLEFDWGRWSASSPHRFYTREKNITSLISSFSYTHTHTHIFFQTHSKPSFSQTTLHLKCA
jgi:hypothetical protein